MATFPGDVVLYEITLLCCPQTDCSEAYICTACTIIMHAYVHVNHADVE